MIITEIKRKIVLYCLGPIQYTDIPNNCWVRQIISGPHNDFVKKQ